MNDVSLLLNWKPNGLHVPYYAAKAQGYYEEQGIDSVEIKSGQGSDFSAKQVGLGKSTFGITSADQVINVNSRELSPISVGIVMQKTPVVVFSVRDVFGGKLRDPEQLRGKTIGTGPGMVRLMTKLYLKRTGVFSSVELVNTGYSTVQQLLAGKIDVAGGVFGDAIDARHQGNTTDVLSVAKKVPAYGHVVATAEDFASEHPVTVEAFLRATARGAAWAAKNPNAATDSMIDIVSALSASQESVHDKWVTLAREYMLSRAVRNHGWGWSEGKPWQVVTDALQEADFLGGRVDPATVWTNEHLDRNYRYVGSYADVVSRGE